MMKRLMIAIVASLFLSACAGMQGQPTTESLIVDGRYMQAVEQNARRMGVRVEWVNPPRQERVEAPESREIIFRPSSMDDSASQD
ncbi:hypothetical protein AY599_07080 [Leptolyngbya valderiana BDU 20041]|nr:hypothetical protein AY599_07080 [Leptolyngbya valderiana BDU 20041]